MEIFFVREDIKIDLFAYIDFTSLAMLSLSHMINKHSFFKIHVFIRNLNFDRIDFERTEIKMNMNILILIQALNLTKPNIIINKAKIYFFFG